VGDRKRLQALYRERVKTHAVKVGKRVLGRGRSSVVYEGFMDQQRVALKMYKDKTISSKERQVLETTKYALLRQSCTVHHALLNPYLLPLVCLCHRHPNVVHCYGTDDMCTLDVLCNLQMAEVMSMAGEGVDKDKKHYLVFERLHSNLTALLKEIRLPLAQLIRILKKVAKGMAYVSLKRQPTTPELNALTACAVTQVSA
jgi:hypothetical protein